MTTAIVVVSRDEDSVSFYYIADKDKLVESWVEDHYGTTVSDDLVELLCGAPAKTARSTDDRLNMYGDPEDYLARCRNPYEGKLRILVEFARHTSIPGIADLAAKGTFDRFVSFDRDELASQ